MELPPAMSVKMTNKKPPILRRGGFGKNMVGRHHAVPQGITQKNP
jgi:hypothetical protein